MYAIYQQVCEEGKLKLKLFEKDISLAGCNVGIIPNLLKSKLSQSDNEPHPWHLPILDIYKSQAKSVIIDIKPKNRKEDSIFICELTDVFGYSDRLWTPILFRLNTLFVDLPSGEIDKLCFEYPKDPGFIYTMSYLAGSIQSGKLTGTWNLPGPSSTNSVLLWPKVLSHFVKSIKMKDPDFLSV